MYVGGVDKEDHSTSTADSRHRGAIHSRQHTP